MNPDMNQQGFPPNEFYDNYQSSGSNSSNWQESATRFRGHGHYQGMLSFYSNFYVDFFLYSTLSNI